MNSVPRQHWSIGEVLNLLQDEFPEVTISKIRFLEGQGLIDPERTPSGYRRFFPEDFDRLRWVLIQQRDNYLPLRVIRDRLDSGEVTFEPGGEFPDTSPLQRTLGFGESNDAEPVDDTTGHTNEPESDSEPAPEADAPGWRPSTTVPAPANRRSRSPLAIQPLHPWQTSSVRHRALSIYSGSYPAAVK